MNSQEAQFYLTWVSIGCSLLLFFGLMVFGLFNCHKYIIKQRGHLLLFYIFSIFVCCGRIGRLVTIIVNYTIDNEMNSILAVMVDCLIQCSLVVVGMCLCVLMFQLYTYLQWNLIALEAAGNLPRMHQIPPRNEQAEEKKKSATFKLSVMKFVLHVLMVLAFAITGTLLVMTYLKSDYATENPMTVSFIDFVRSQQSESMYGLFTLNAVFLYQSILFILTAALLYTSIYFVISQISDLQQQNNLTYQEGSGSMEKEMKRLKAIMSVFGFSYILRFAYNFSISLYELEFAVFQSEHPGFSQLILFAYFMVTDALPIGMVFYMHYMNYR